MDLIPNKNWIMRMDTEENETYVFTGTYFEGKISEYEVKKEKVLSGLTNHESIVQTKTDLQKSLIGYCKLQIYYKAENLKFKFKNVTLNEDFFNGYELEEVKNSVSEYVLKMGITLNKNSNIPKKVKKRGLLKLLQIL